MVYPTKTGLGWSLLRIRSVGLVRELSLENVCRHDLLSAAVHEVREVPGVILVHVEEGIPSGA